MAEHTIDIPARYEKALKAAADQAGVGKNIMLLELAKNALEAYITAELVDITDKMRRIYEKKPAKFVDLQTAIDTEYATLPPEDPPEGGASSKEKIA